MGCQLDLTQTGSEVSRGAGMMIHEVSSGTAGIRGTHQIPLELQRMIQDGIRLLWRQDTLVQLAAAVFLCNLKHSN